VNCAALPAELLESELFGHEKGAFTGAATTRIGKFEQAHFGTIFLDEIGEMKPPLQAKLLHVLQDAEFTKLGSNKRITVDVRVVAATNRDLEQMMLRGDFREDLYYRLKVIEATVPPLRERRDEIVSLAEFFITKYSQRYKRPIRPLSEPLRAQFLEYEWPGNVRELENCVRFLTCLQADRAVEPADLPLLGRSASPSSSFRASKRALVDTFERRYLDEALRKSGGNIAQAAQASGKARRAFFELMRKHGMEALDYKTDDKNQM
jgi:transcriptional regulator with PAS, ATPase and Fis domain